MPASELGDGELDLESGLGQELFCVGIGWIESDIEMDAGFGRLDCEDRRGRRGEDRCEDQCRGQDQEAVAHWTRLLEWTGLKRRHAAV